MIRFIGACGILVSILATACGGGSTPSGINISIPSSLSFGQVPNGTQSPERTVTITNTGSTAFTFSKTPSISGTNSVNFTITATTCSTASTLSPSASCTVTIVFTPSATSDAAAQLDLSIATASNTVSIPLTGAGVTAVENVLPGQVTLGTSGNVNAFFVTITICVPGTSTCQTIPNITIDTGSSGLRLVKSAVTLPLAQALSNSGDPLGNCVQFADMSYAFGPVKKADIHLSGEIALNQSIQLIGDSSFAPTPTGSNGCVVSGGLAINSSATLGANGLLGLGLFKEDCGIACALSAIPGIYYACSGSSCSPTTVALSSQLHDPVWEFNQDNNGFLITLPSISPTGASVVQGQLIFGINTKTNNALGSAQIYTANTVGNISTTYAGSTYASFIDSGSNGMFFLSEASTSLTSCSSARGFYCPASATNFSVVNEGENGNSGTVNFSIGNAESIFLANPSYSAFNNIGGPFPGTFDFGLPFFFGRTIFFGIEGQLVGAETGPLYAY